MDQKPPPLPRQKELISPYELESRLPELARTERRSKLLMAVFFIAAMALLVLAIVAHYQNINASADTSAFQRLGTLFGICCAACFVLSGFFLIKGIKDGKQLKLLASDNVTRIVLAEVFELAAYDPVGLLPKGEVAGAGLVESWNTMSGSDLIKGRYKGADFSFSDIRLTYINETNQDAKVIERFEGQWLIVGLSTELPSPLWLIARKGLGKLAKSDVETGNAAFDKAFKVKTQDPQVARYVLTPQFMDSLLRMGQKADAGVHVGFTGRQCNIALYSKRDLFEMKGVRLSGKNGIEQLHGKIRQDAKCITDILDELLVHGHLFGGGGSR